MPGPIEVIEKRLDALTKPKRKMGRPPGPTDVTIKKQEIRAMILARFAKRIDELVEAQMDHAMGVNYMVLREPDGSFTRATNVAQIDAACAAGASAFKIFTQAPNPQAFVAIADRAIDRPTEHHEVTGADGGPVEMVARLAAARKRLAGT